MTFVNVEEPGVVEISKHALNPFDQDHDPDEVSTAVGLKLVMTLFEILSSRGIETNLIISDAGVTSIRITVSKEAATILRQELPGKGFPLALPN